MLLSLLRCVPSLDGVATLAGGSLNMHTIIHLLHEEQTLVSQGASKHGTGGSYLQYSYLQCTYLQCAYSHRKTSVPYV